MQLHADTTPAVTDSGYVLGHSERELRRLTLQSRYWLEPTLHTLKQAGLAPGMRVLDIGCGAGDVALLAASLVGPTGSVVGIDRSPEAINRASARAASEGVGNVSFHVADIDERPEVCGPFDAVVGRFVLMYLPNPVVTLRALHSLLTPRGVVAFVEMDIEAARAVPAIPFIDTLLGWVVETFRRGNFATSLGPQVWRLLRDSGFADPANEVWWEASPAPARELTTLLAETTRTLLPMMEKFGIADATAVDIETLGDRLQAELLAARATLLPPAVVGTWGRLQP